MHHLQCTIENAMPAEKATIATVKQRNQSYIVNS